VGEPIPISQIQFLLDESKIHAHEMLRKQLRDFDPIDLAASLSDLGHEEKIRLIRALDPESAALVLDETDPDSRSEILEVLDVPVISDLVEALPPDEGADLLQQLPDEKEEEVLGDMPPESAAELRQLTDYDPDTAGGMMTPDFVWVPDTATAEEALSRVKGEEEAEHYGEVYVLDEAQRLVGVIPIQEFLEHPGETVVADFLHEKPRCVELYTDQQDAANLVQKYNLPSLPVVDAQGRMKGVITLDDVMDVIEEEAEEDIFRLAGSISPSLAGEPVRRKYAKRLPFLITTFLGGVMTIVIQYLFRLTTDQLITLTFFIPIINGLSGNVGLQSSTIMVRGFATGEIDFRRVFRLLPREVITGFLIGATFGTICGILTALMAGSLDSRPLLGLVVGISMTCGTTMAAFLGTAVPALCERMGIDPAISAGPFIATLLDSTALLLYLGIATVMIRSLLLT
jgi:magnesium transporter